MGWEYGPGGYRVWIDPKTGKEGTPPAGSRERQDRRERGGDDRKKTGTNVWGGPKGTKKDAAGRSYGDPRHVRHGPQPQSSRDRAVHGKAPSTGAGGKGGDVERGGLSDSERQQIAEESARAQAEADARVKAQAERQARIAEAKNKVERRAAKRLNKMEKAIAQREREAIASIDANNAAAMELRNQAQALVSAGDVEGARKLEQQANALEERNVKHRVDILDARSGINRAQANEELVRIAKDAGQPLTPEQKRQRRQNKKTRRSIIENSTIPSLAALQYGEIRPGDAGYAQAIRKAQKDVEAYYEANPDQYDPDVITFLGKRLETHSTRLNDANQDIIDEADRLVGIIEEDPTSKAARRAISRLGKLQDEYKENLEGLQKELNVLYGKEVKTKADGTVIRRKNSGLVNAYVKMADKLHDQNVQYQLEQVYGPGVTREVRGYLEDETAHILWNEATKSVHEVPDPAAPGGVRMQTPTERLNEMVASGEMTREQALTIGQNRLTDYAAAARDWSDDPVLQHVLPYLAENNIQSNLDLTGGFDQTILERDIVVPAVEDAYNAWRELGDDEPVGTQFGIYEEGRYGKDEDGKYFVLTDGTIVRPGDPMPEGMPEPLWNHGEGGIGPILRAPTLQERHDNHMRQGRAAKKQDIEDTVREAFGIADTGFMGDAQAHVITGPVLDWFGTLTGAIGSADYLIPGDIGIDVSNEIVQGEYVPSVYRETVLDPETHTVVPKWDPAKYWVVSVEDAGLVGEQGFIHDALNLIFGYESHVVIPKDAEEGGPVALSQVYRVPGPLGGLIEFTNDRQESALEGEAARQEAQQEALATGDLALFGRVSTDQGVVPVQFGGAAGLINFSAEMAFDPTNWIPFAAVAKASLRGLKAVGLAARTAPKGMGAAGRLGLLVDGFRGAAQVDPIAVELNEIFGFIRKLAPDLPEEQVQGAFRAGLANVDGTLKGPALIDDVVLKVGKALGMGPGTGKDLTILRQWASTEIMKVMRHRGWIVHTQADDLARTVKLADDMVAANQAEGAALEMARANRNAGVIAKMNTIGKQARRGGGEARAASESFERQALELADNTPLERLEELATRTDLPQEQLAVYMRARDLSRARRGIEGGAVTGGQGGRVNLEDLEFKGAQRTPKKTKAERDLELKQADAVKRAEARARREARLQKRREEREIESRNRAAEMAGSDARQPAPAIRQARSLADEGRNLLDEAPASWTSPTGPKFWGQTLASRPSGSFTAGVRGASQFVDAVAQRFGRWDGTVAPVRAITNRGVKRVLGVGDGSAIAGEPGRRLYAAYLRQLDGFPDGWRIRRNGDAIYDPKTGEVIDLTDEAVEAPSFEQFQQMWRNRGRQDATTVFGPEITGAYDELIVSGGLVAEDSFELNTILLAQLQFNPDVGARHALGYLDAVGRLPRAADNAPRGAQELVRGLFKGELDAHYSRLAKEAVDPRGTEYEAIIDNDLMRLAIRLDGAPRAPRTIDPKIPPARDARQLVGYAGFDVDRAIGRVIQNPGDVQAVSEVASILSLAHVTTDQWGAVQKVARALGRAPSKSAAGRAARALREQMHKELDALGYVRQGDEWVPFEGTNASRVASEQHAAFISEMGQSEEAWLRARIKRNVNRINNRNTTKGERRFLLDQNETLNRAIEDIKVRKNGGTYEPPKTSKEQAVRGAESVRERVKGVIPPKIHAFYAKTKAAANVELARSVRVAAKNNIVKPGVKNNVLEEALDNFPIARYQELNDYVGAAIRRVQGRRESSLGLRRPPGDDLPDETLRSLSDKHPDIIAAKNQAIDEWCAKNGIDRLHTDAYDRIRTLLQPHISRKIRTDLLIDEVGEGADNFDDAFLGLRKAATDQDAVDNIAWMLRENPGMTVEEATRRLELSYLTDGKLKSGGKEITETDARVYAEYFRALTGENIDDVAGVKRALQAEDTLPPLDEKFSFRQHQERIGEWSPRSLDEIDESRPPWSMDEERAWFEMRYGEAPAWVSDPRFEAGGAAFINSRHQHLEILRETGNFDERLRIAAQLQDDGEIGVKDIVHGDTTRKIKPVKDLDQERLYAVSRYGDRVGTIDDAGNIRMTAMPWLMHPDEYSDFVMSGVKGADSLFKADEVTEAVAAIGRLAEKYVDQFQAAARITDPAEMIVPSSAAHEYAFYMMVELSQSKPWAGVLGKISKGDALDAWTAFWSGLVVGNPGWIASNVVDQWSKTGAFAGQGFARKGVVAGAKGSDNGSRLVPSLESLGVENSGIFGSIRQERGLATRLSSKTTYGARDRIGAGWDAITLKPISQKLVSDLSDRVPKLHLARSIANGMDIELRPALKAKGLSDETIDLAIRFRTKKQIERLYPSLQNRTYTERLLNRIFPFISYNFRNRMLWLTIVADHPWLVHLQQQVQQGVVEHNTRDWAERHPGWIIPEHLMHQIRVPGTDIYIDIAMYTDSARGADLIMGGKPITLADIQKTVLRPLPSQVATFKALGWNLFGAFGRQRYQKVLNEDGSWTPGNYETVIVPPGTAWGDEPLDFMQDLFWVSSFVKAAQRGMEDGEWDYQDTVRVIGSIASFGEWAEPSRYYIANQQYHALHDVDPQLAYDWLDESPEGQWLKSEWDAQFYKPTHTNVDPFVLKNAAMLDVAAKEGLPPFLVEGYPDPVELRKQWFGLQSPEYREMLQDSWAELGVANEHWDATLAEAKPEDVEYLEGVRRAWYAQFYHSNPHVWQYIGMGMAPEDFDNDIFKIHLEDKRNTFFALYGWDQKPEDEKEAKKWEKSREKYLKQNPDVAQSLSDDMNAFERARQEVNESWDKSFAAITRLEHAQDALREADMWDEAAALDGIRDIFDSTFEIEAFGRGDDGMFKAGKDLLTLRLQKAAGDPKAEAEVWYSARMEAAMKEAGGSRSKWYRVMEKNRDLLKMYFQKNPDKKATWKKDKFSATFWERFSRLADAGKWDAAWGAWDDAPEWFKQDYRNKHPEKWRKFEQSSRYSGYMKHWVSLFEAGKSKEAMDYFWSLPEWARERYFKNNPGSQLSSGRGTLYISTLNEVFDAIDAGNWDAAEKIWKSAPSWVRKRYYSNNPDSNLFRGKSGGSGGGGISDAKYKKYVRSMKRWVELMRDGDKGAADKYFRSLPKWMQDFYLKRNPDKALLQEDMKMQTLLEEYFGANRAEQQAMLENNPALSRWLMENDTTAQRNNAIMFVYSRLEDPWLKRVFAEKYPEIFSKEARGEQKRQQIQDILKEHPEFRAAWQRWFDDIEETLAESMKHALAKPRAGNGVDYSYVHKRPHGMSMSAEEVQASIDETVLRSPKDAKRMPRFE